MTTTDVDNWPADADGVQGPDLMERFRRHAERFDTEIIHDHIHSAQLARRPLLLEGDMASYTCDALIIATGASAKYLGLPSEQKFMGRGVSACATCDGFFYKNKDVFVVGGGDTAMEEATFLTKFASKVTVVHRRDALRASKIMQDRAFKNPKIAWLWDTIVEKILGGHGKGVTGAVVKNLKTGKSEEIKTGGIFMAIGHEPNTALFRGVLEMDEAGYLLTRDGTTATNVAGVYAAGDVADHLYRQAVTAAGSGCMAAIDAEKFLTLHEEAEDGRPQPAARA